ncbi:hypothetical protein Poli38472_000086 [Pythium oligandrum]|uniref:Uncharacterized protein n=1 Tax=Pythium oligandrum TaxID=41045 RepID=A0A8K1FGI4_PYTOL|nr:hypothetical protein Poli38472_000086 [Pythium oligandrum]|eukprot:TMW60044.1 hypothetical protein Poli38472_000086 [Pythium oligandrum]
MLRQMEMELRSERKPATRTGGMHVRQLSDDGRVSAWMKPSRDVEGRPEELRSPAQPSVLGRLFPSPVRTSRREFAERKEDGDRRGSFESKATDNGSEGDDSHIPRERRSSSHGDLDHGTSTHNRRRSGMQYEFRLSDSRLPPATESLHMNPDLGRSSMTSMRQLAAVQHLNRAQSAETIRSQSNEPRDDVSLLREQVALLIRCLEDEKKRRASEQTLMQQKILELQSLIRHNLPEQQLELEQQLQSRASLQARGRIFRTAKQIQKSPGRGPYKTMQLISELRGERTDVHSTDSEDNGGRLDEEDEDEERESGVHECEIDTKDAATQSDNQLSPARRGSVPPDKDDENKMNYDNAELKQQLTTLRARMHTKVTEAQKQTDTLQLRLEEERRIFERKEQQLRIETNARLLAMEEKHAQARRKLTSKGNQLTADVASLTAQNLQLQRELDEKNARIQQLELALQGRRVMRETVFGSS